MTEVESKKPIARGPTAATAGAQFAQIDAARFGDATVSSSPVLRQIGVVG